MLCLLFGFSCSLQDQSEESVVRQNLSDHGGDSFTKQFGDIDQGSFVHDTRGAKETFSATENPAPPRSDALRTFRVRWMIEGQRQSWAFEGQSVLDARLIPHSEAVVVVTRSKELVLLQTPDSEPETLDHQVEAPLSLSHTGRFLVYSKGDMPFFELFRLDLESRQVTEVTKNMAPAWGAAISNDGEHVVFASSVTGSSKLYRIRVGDADLDNAPRLLSDQAENQNIPIPTGPNASQWLPQGILFENGDGTHLISETGDHLLSLQGGHLPRFDPELELLVVHKNRQGLDPQTITLSSVERIRP